MTTDTTVYICNRKHYILCYTSCVTTYQNDKKIMCICHFFYSLHYAGVPPRQARWQHFKENTCCVTEMMILPDIPVYFQATAVRTGRNPYITVHDKQETECHPALRWYGKSCRKLFKPQVHRCGNSVCGQAAAELCNHSGDIWAETKDIGSRV